MFRALCLLASIVGASAFSPVSNVARSSSLKMSYDSALGAQAPLGFWDPLNLLDGVSEKRFTRLRDIEIKHGRIAQLAVLGHIVTSKFADYVTYIFFYYLYGRSNTCFP